MTFRANLTEALRSLNASRQRTLLALVGIVIGIASVIALLNTGQIIAAESLRQFSALGTDLLTIRQTENSADQTRRGAKDLPLREALAIPANCPSIAVVAPTMEAPGDLVYQGKKIGTPIVSGVTHTFATLNKLRLARGRFIVDVDRDQAFCVLGHAMAQALHRAGGLKARSQEVQVSLWGRYFTVVGELAPLSPGLMRPYAFDDSVYIPAETFIRMQTDPRIRTLSARMRPGADHFRARRELTAYYARLSRPPVEVRSAVELIEQKARQMRLFTLLLGTIGSISLIVGGVGVMNVMLVSVAERKKEIGIRRAIGARRKDIQGQFLLEAIILSIIGGIAGIIAGVTVTYALARFNGWVFTLSGSALLIGVGVSSVIGLFFGFYPARSAARLDPITALRGE